MSGGLSRCPPKGEAVTPKTVARTVIVGGGAAGIGAAGAAKAADRQGEVIVYTEYEDAAYSPCGIPYVHGREIPDFDRLFLAGKEAYVQAGIDIHYNTKVTAVDLARRQVAVEGEGDVAWDRLVIARGLEMVTALAHRGIETHLVDPHPWALSEAADPDIAEPVQESWAEMGVKMHFNTRLEEFLGDGNGKVRGVRTSEGELPADLVVICTKKMPRNDLAANAGIKIGSTGGIIVDERMATSASGVWAGGDCIEVPHGVSNVPLQGLSGSHAYSQGKVAGTNAAGGRRRYQPVYVPWGMVAGKWMIGGVSFGETLATALGIPYVLGKAQGISRARYYPDMKKITVKLLAEPGSLRLIGAQLVGGEGIKERADFLAMAVKVGITLEDLAFMENVYSPPIGALNEPIALAAQNGLANLKG